MTIEAVSRKDFEEQLETIRALAPGEAEGVFGPASPILPWCYTPAPIGAARITMAPFAVWVRPGGGRVASPRRAAENGLSLPMAFG
jgi:hypothetical protein